MSIKHTGLLLATTSTIAISTLVGGNSASAEEVSSTLDTKKITIVDKTSVDEIKKAEKKAKEKAEKVKKEKAEKEKANKKPTKPVDVHTVKIGDTLGKIGEKYNLSYEDIMLWNNLESDLIFVGDELNLYPTEPETVIEEVVEEPKQVAKEKPKKKVAQAAEVSQPKQVSKPVQQQKQAQSQPNTQPTQSTSPSFSGGSNPFPVGECTYHAFSKRASMGKGVGNWGNASNWANVAASQGYSVNNRPSVGAIVVSNAYQNGSGYYGHVAIVEAVHNDGSITISESNWNGNRYETFRTISASQVSNHTFIH